MGVNGIYGLSGSGIDVESMVKVGMMSKQNEYDKMYKKETKMSWQKEAYSTVYTDLMNFGMNKLTDYKLQSNMNAMSATSNNTAAVSVSANGSAVAMSHKVEVTSLSSNAYLMSTKEITRTAAGSSGSIQLKDSMFKSITFNNDADPENTDNPYGTYTVVDSKGDTHTYKGNEAALSFVVDDGNSDASEKDRTITFTYKDLADGKTFNDLASQIKGLGMNVTASYDSVNDTFALYNSKGGKENTISLTMKNADSAVLFNNLNLGQSKDGELTALTGHAQISSAADIVRANTSEPTSTQMKDILFQDIGSVYNVNGIDGDFVKSEESDGVTKLYTANGSVGAYVKKDQDGKYITSTDNSTWSSPLENNPLTTSATKYAVKGADGTTSVVNAEDKAFSFKLSDGQAEEEVSFTYADLANGKSLSDLATKINDLGLNVQASYSSNGSFNLYNNATENGTDIKLSGMDANAQALFSNLKLGDSTGHSVSGDSFTATKADNFFTYNDSAAKQAASTISGTSGSIKVDGREYDNITDNKITVAGVTYTLMDKTTSAATVTVTQDTASIIDRVKQFVEDYNAMLDELQDKYHETIYSDYGVLTKSQEDGMTKEQIEKWNEKAKSGLLNHDKIIGDIISKMREALATPVEGVNGKYNSAFNIGITTTNDRGHIKLDDEKLKKVLDAEPNSVYQIFGKLDANDDYNKNGVAQRLGDVVSKGMSKIKEYAGTNTEAADGSTLGTKILEWQNKMSDFKTKMTAFENLLYEKYDAMEVALQRLGMTLNYVTFGQN